MAAVGLLTKHMSSKLNNTAQAMRHATRSANTGPGHRLELCGALQPSADAIEEETRKLLIEFSEEEERSCLITEFSGFLLYKELARRMKASGQRGGRGHTCSRSVQAHANCIRYMQLTMCTVSHL